MRTRTGWVSIVALSTAIVVLAISTGAFAATQTWDGGAGTVAGNINNGLSTQQTLNFYLWDIGTTANWTGSTFTANDAAVFSLNNNSTNLIRVTTSALDPASLTFTGNSTYDFLRASSAIPTPGLNQGGSNYAGWHSIDATGAQLTPAAYSIAGPDSFGSSGFTDANLAVTYPTTSGSITLGTGAGTGFTGTVILRARPAAAAGFTGTHTVNSGTLEIHDGAALPAAVQNNPSLTLNGGTLNVNIDTGNYTFRTGNTTPASAQLGGALSVTANSTLGNTAVDVYGRARQQAQLWNGNISVTNASTLTINTGGGTTITGINASTLSGNGTIKIGAAAANNGGSNRLRLTGTGGSAGSQTLTFDLGTDGILQNAAGMNTTTSLGSVVAPSGTTITGSSNNASAAATSSSTISIGAANVANTISGTIVNGVANANGGGTGTPPTTPPNGSRTVANTNLTKVGTQNLSLNNKNYYGGTTNVNNGTLTTGNAHALGGGTGAVTVATGGTLEMNGVTQTAGKSYVLSGGSLVNNTNTATSIHDGASANFGNNAGATGSGNWSSGTPTVTLSSGGGSGATGQVILQLGWLRFSTSTSPTTDPNVGSGYVTEPKISFSAPDLSAAQGGRPIKAVAIISNNGANRGQVTAVDIVDPGFGYTSVPTMTIDNTGSGGSGFNPTFSMTAGAIEMTNGGSGYTSAPTVTFGGAGYLGNSAVGVGGVGAGNLGIGAAGNITLTTATTSSIGNTVNGAGNGNIGISAPIAGSGNLDKVGDGTVTMSNANNTYTGVTTVKGGTLLVHGNNTGTGDVVVNSGATLGGHGSIAGKVIVGGTLSPGGSVGTLTINNSLTMSPASTLAMELTGTNTNSTPGNAFNDMIVGVTALDLGSSTLNVTDTGTNTFLSANSGDRWKLILYSGALTNPGGLALGSMPALTSGLSFSIDTSVSGEIGLLVSSASVPEASSFLLVGLVGVGTAGVARYRRRRQTVA